MDSSSSRRSSMSNSSAQVVMASHATHSPDDADHVRKWAEHTMTSQPLPCATPPSLDSSDFIAFNSGRRESEGGHLYKAKTSAPAGIYVGAFDDTPYRPFASGSIARPPGLLRSRASPLADDYLPDRPSSMILTSNVVVDDYASAADTYIQQQCVPSRLPRLKSCLKMAGAPNEEQDPATPIAPSSSSSLPFAVASSAKSVHISEDLPRRNYEAMQQPASSSSSFNDASPVSIGSSASTRLVRRNAAHRRLASEGKSLHSSVSRASLSSTYHGNSPHLSTSTFDSEEDDAPMLVTPLDEHGPSYTGDTPPIDTLGDGVADRVGIARGMGQVGDSVSEPLRLMTQLQFAARRPSVTANVEEDEKKDKDARSVQQQQQQHSSATQAIPLLSHSTLLDIGREAGLTPPTSRSSGVQQSTASVLSPTSIVSTGLEMGLGVAMASSALCHQLPPSSTSGLNSMMEPRFSRMHGIMDVGTMTSGPRMTDRETSTNEHVQQTQQTVYAVKSDREAAEPTFEELDRDDAELNRRRTTGGLQSRREPSGVVGKRRIHRTGTQDPHGTRTHKSSQAHLREAALPTTEEGTGSGSGNSANHSRSSTSAGSQSAEPTPFDVNAGTTSTLMDTPSHGHKPLLSPSIGHRLETGSFRSHGEREIEERGANRQADAIRGANVNMAGVGLPQQPAANNLAVGLMGIGEAGHFGPGVRAKVAQLIEALIPLTPMTGDEDEVVNIIEYGALSSRSGLLLRPAISALAKRGAQLDNEQDEAQRTAAKEGYFDFWTSAKKNLAPSVARQSSTSSQISQSASQLTFCVTHEDSSSSDFRPMTQMLETHRDSYLDAHWQARHTPCLSNAIFPSFAARPFASRIAPPRTMHLGISLMDLHWTHTPISSTVSRATTAQAELTAFLNTRAKEFKKDGLLVLAYIARGEEERQASFNSSSDGTMPDDDGVSTTSSVPPNATGRKDIWTTLSNTLAPCIQRLVSCGMLKSDVARHLLDLPMHPRTAKQTRAALKSVADSWEVQWSCGLGQGEEPSSARVPTSLSDGDDASTSFITKSEPMPLRLPHPAWKAYESGCLSRVPFTEHMIQLFKNLYENHFRTVLRERGRLSKGAVEFVLDSLWDALFSRIVDQNPSSVKDVEIEVCIYALRRL